MRISAPLPGSVPISFRRCELPLIAEPPVAEPPAERLYGRARGHTLRPRQRVLLAETLPRLRLSTPVVPASTNPLWLEIGFGGGEHALAQIVANPDMTLIACEVFANGICSLLSRLVPQGAEATAPLPANLRLWDADARILLRGLADSSLDQVFLLFPDPWPKARHAKRRFVQPGNISLVANKLRPGGEWRIASDDPTYQEWVDARMGATPQFALRHRTAARPPGWPPTRYEAKALRAGRTPLYWSFIRTPLCGDEPALATALPCIPTV